MDCLLSDDALEDKLRRVARTKVMYREVFGEAPSNVFWSLSMGSMQIFVKGGRNRTIALGVKACRLMVHAGSARRAPHAVLACVDGTPDLAAPGGSNAAPEHLQEEQSAMNKYCAIGVVNGREEELLRNYFERVRVSEGRRQQMFQEEGGVPWVFVSTPERIPDGHGGHEQVMEFIQGICRELPRKSYCLGNGGARL